MFSTVTGNIKLSHFEGMCKDKPMLLILRENDNTFSARASVPESFVNKTKEGNAHTWLFTAFQLLKEASLLHKDSNQYVKAPPGKDKNNIFDSDPLGYCCDHGMSHLLSVYLV